MSMYNLYGADVTLRNCSLTHCLELGQTMPLEVRTETTRLVPGYHKKPYKLWY